MQLLLIHSEGFSWIVKEKAVANAEPLTDNLRKFSTNDSVIVAFVAVEENDIINKNQVIENAVFEVQQALKDIGETNIVLYPWVHLAKGLPAKPSDALNFLQDLYEGLRTGLPEIILKRAPFGYYKSFNLNCKGHALAERSKDIHGDESKPLPALSSEIMTAIKAEEESKSNFFIFTQKGELIPYNEFKFGELKDFQTFVSYETAKDRTVSSPPKHVDVMKKLELVDYEEGSDQGNFRILPRGFIVKQLIENHVSEMAAQYGAMIVETPLMYSYEHPSLKKYLDRFPARQYIVKSGERDYFLRFAACFGQFLTLADATISYRQLPLKIFELAKSFRREQRGELAGIRRLRAFTMPDLHTVVSDLEMGQKEFEKQFKLANQYMEDIEISFETAFRMSTTFFNEKKEWISALIKDINKPILLELFETRYAYFILKFEFNIVDSQQKAAALSTVQIDVENSERFDIKYIDDKGLEKRPFLLHCSLSGSTERVIYGILEDQLEKANQGLKPQLPMWLSPIQIRIIPLSQDYMNYAEEIADQIEEKQIRVEIDDRDLSLAKKIRAAEKLWSPIILVVGEAEKQQKTVNVRYRKENKQLVQKLEEVIIYVKERTENKPSFFRILPRLVSQQPIFTRLV